MDEATRQTVMFFLLGAIFLIIGGYFGLHQKKVGLREYAPLTGSLAEIWGWMMCGIGGFVIFVGLA